LIDVAEASFQLGIGRTHLYRLRTRFLKERSKFAATLSGGDHWPDWPPQVVAFLKEFLPLVVYTDGLSLFGHDSMADDRDPCSEFQRAFSALGVTHLVAPSPQARGTIERRFGTLQKRLVALLAYEKVSHYAAAQMVLDREVQRQNATVCRTTGLSPNAAWKKALEDKRTATRPCPPATLLDLHLALHLKRRVNSDSQIDFLGQAGTSLRPNGPPSP
jgi:hypothetical protein